MTTRPTNRQIARAERRAARCHTEAAVARFLADGAPAHSCLRSVARRASRRANRATERAVALWGYEEQLSRLTSERAHTRRAEQHSMVAIIAETGLGR